MDKVTNLSSLTPVLILNIFEGFIQDLPQYQPKDLIPTSKDQSSKYPQNFCTWMMVHHDDFELTRILVFSSASNLSFCIADHNIVFPPDHPHYPKETCQQVRRMHHTSPVERGVHWCWCQGGYSSPGTP